MKTNQYLFDNIAINGINNCNTSFPGRTIYIAYPCKSPWNTCHIFIILFRVSSGPVGHINFPRCHCNSIWSDSWFCCPDNFICIQILFDNLIVTIKNNRNSFSPSFVIRISFGKAILAGVTVLNSLSFVNSALIPSHFADTTKERLLLPLVLQNT